MGCKQSRATGERPSFEDVTTAISNGINSIQNKPEISFGGAPSAATAPLETVDPTPPQEITTTKPEEPSNNASTGAVQPSPIPPSATEIPDGAEIVTVRNVYDGDTFTLTDERRVRLLAIDAPEIKEKEPFAVESRDYARALIKSANKIYLVKDTEDTDKYGRLLRYVYIESQDGSIQHLNCKILEAGLGRYYNPGATLTKGPELYEAASQARKLKNGIWKDFDEDKLIYTTRTGIAYHTKDCTHIANSKPIEMTAGKAIDSGKSACRTCAP